MQRADVRFDRFATISSSRTAAPGAPVNHISRLITNNPIRLVEASTIAVVIVKLPEELKESVLRRTR